MIHRLCISCGRNPERNSGKRKPLGIFVETLDGVERIGHLCRGCADPARFSTAQLADAIIAEFQRQLSPTKKGTTQ